LSARLNHIPRRFPQELQWVGSLAGAADSPRRSWVLLASDSVPDLFPFMPVTAYLTETNNLV